VGSKILKSLIVFFLCITYLFGAVDINNATSKELMELNGVGKAKAAKIIAYRDQNQCFKSIDELSKIDGISKNIVLANKDILTLGECEEKVSQSGFTATSFIDILLNPVNFTFVIIIFLLAFIDQKTKKDLKSQIVSVGVLGTFVGIFIGLQGFNPDEIISSVNKILVGLKTAFFTSIVGMSVATTLSIIDKLRSKSERE
jgi:competence ComEA-like helix-hairpin-helix protein